MKTPKLTTKQIIDRLVSVEQLCHDTRRLMGFGVPSPRHESWGKDVDVLAQIADLLDDANSDLASVAEDIEARQIATEVP
jgi:hypothetical protein